MSTTLQKLDFKIPDISDYSKIISFLKPFAEKSMSCEITPMTLLIWKNYYHQKIAFYDDMMFVSLGENSEIFLLPFADDMKKAVNILKDYQRSRNRALVFLGAEGVRLDTFNELFCEEFSQTESRDDFEYLYLTEKLKNLSGKKFHSKRNHISAFSKAHEWSYETLTPEILPEVFKMADRWTEEMKMLTDDPKSIEVENAALKEYLPQMQKLNLCGGCIRVNGEIIAFTFGSPINSKVFDIHVEKALPEFRTAYSLINREFIANELCDFEYVNREDDMGLEGLRKAKLSYRPDILLKKYVIREL
ncbi:MAG: DUF2156 domain-containing protein [Clostridia bacterium]|nr:DUF2156 domain-containing protein [Clostridia bacterium]